ncbi:MAG: GntR family transcriptional regulator [Oscillospiraceae bacterium]|nr:GntR family transcriptional regulator [Oscillospiraceae bacterium]
MRFNFESDTPIYMQVAEQIEDAVLSGAFGEETQIPSTTEISVTYKINPATVLKGMALLAEAEILYKKRGVGMFVSKGAAGTILKQRKEAFYKGYIVRLLEEAQKLHISQQEIVKMIEEGKADA